ncbi:hypothetical protein GHT06_003819 [Daphnia sinensis]|uniref:Uncharacterized protein n=1 Tax=Daphnia sinensis TaxID=1820382 RepID=A0AAD5L2C6_9CRUS|nr:hypothetical protein GHT06_003819 [Daphnia sinensis]
MDEASILAALTRHGVHNPEYVIDSVGFMLDDLVSAAQHVLNSVAETLQLIPANRGHSENARTFEAIFRVNAARVNQVLAELAADDWTGYTPDLVAASVWVNKQATPAARRLAFDLLLHTTFVRWDTYWARMTACARECVDRIKGLPGGKATLVLDQPVFSSASLTAKSSLFLALALWPEFREVIDDVVAGNTSEATVRQKSRMRKTKHENYLFIDDCVYSGTQLGDTVDAAVNIYSPANVLLCVPYSTNRLPALAASFRNMGHDVFIPTAHTVIRTVHELNSLKAFATPFKSQGATLTYFQHKLPDALSSPMVCCVG